MNRRAFTLIEILAVVVILGLIAGAVSITLAASAQKATFTGVIEQVAWLDRTTRRYCVQHGQSARLTFDTFTQIISRPAKDDAYTSTLRLSAARLDRVRTLGSLAGDEEGAITITPAGRSATYALRFVGPTGQVSWLVILGLTGEVVHMDSDGDLDAFFDAMRGAAQ